MSTTGLNPLVDKIRAKYPGAYDDLSDAELTTKILAKYPQYGDLAQPYSKPPTDITKVPSYQGNYGASAGNVLKNIGQFVKGAAGVTKDVLDPRVPLVEGQNSLLNKYVVQPAQQQFATGQQEGGALGTTNKFLAQNVPVAGPMIGALAEQVNRGDIGGAATQGALTALLSRGPKDVPEGAEDGTIGMAKGGTPASIERLANRLPVVSGPLKKAYGSVSDAFNSSVTDAVKKASGASVNPNDLAGSLGNGVKSLDVKAKSLYKPVDDYVAQNSSGLVSKVVQSVSADPDILRDLPKETYDNPITGLKMFRDKLSAKGDSLQRGGKGLEANTYYEQARNVQQIVDGVTNTLPANVRTQYQQAQATYARARAMEDIQGVFSKATPGLPTSKQSPATFKRPQTVEAGKLVENLKNEPRLSQAFDPDTAQAIVQHADRLGVAQQLKGSSNAIGGMMLGTGMLLQAFTGNIAHIGPELGGMWLLSKVLATPQAIPLYRNMLRAQAVSEQQFWARQAVAKATNGKGPGE